jgi:hypothetical protein
LHQAVRSARSALNSVPLPLTRQPAAASPHPLDGIDRPVIEALLTASAPSDQNLVDAARLLTRYRDSRLSPDLAPKILEALRNWSLSAEQLHERTRAIWASGWRPPVPEGPQEQQVGSGADVEE